MNNSEECRADTYTYQRNLSAVEDAIYVLGGKWKLRIIVALVSGYHQFNEINV